MTTTVTLIDTFLTTLATRQLVSTDEVTDALLDIRNAALTDALVAEAELAAAPGLVPA